MSVPTKVLALDIETKWGDPPSAWRQEITMVGLYDGKKYHCLRQPWQLRNLLETVYKDYELVCHNAGFDIEFLIVQGWLPEDFNRIVHDTRVLGSLVRNRVPKEFLERYEEMRRELNKTLPKGVSHREGTPLSLKVMAPWYLKVPPFWETPGNHNNEEYNEKDCMYTWLLFQVLAPRALDEGAWEFYINRMLPWQRMIMEMEIRGIAISMEELDKVEQEYLVKRDEMKAKLDELWAEPRAAYHYKQAEELFARYQEMYRKALLKAKDKDKCGARYMKLYEDAVSGIEPFNYSSPVQMAWLLKDYLGLNIVNMDGDESTGKAVLNRLAAEGREDIKTYLEWREADKVLTMYIPTYRELQVDGTIHPSFNLTGTRTGRTSSSGPNLQQVPPKLYRLFKPREGHKFVQYDLSGIEAALIALYSGDKRLFEILEKGESIHDHNAKAMFNLTCSVNEVAQLHPKERKTVKNIGFACFYGAGWRRISQVFAAGGFPISDKEAKDKLAQLKSYYPQAFEFHREITETFEAGETVFNLLGRPVTLQAHENPYMQGFNTLIQSSASDLNLYACERFWKQMKYEGSRAVPLLVIHDCIMAEARNEYAHIADACLTNSMTAFNLESVNGKIQLRVEGGVSERWEK